MNSLPPAVASCAWSRDCTARGKRRNEENRKKRVPLKRRSLLRSAAWQCRMSNAPARLTPLKTAISNSSSAYSLLHFSFGPLPFPLSCQYSSLQVLPAMLAYAPSCPYCSGSASSYCTSFQYQSLLLRKPNTRIFNCPSTKDGGPREKAHPRTAGFLLASNFLPAELSFTSLFSGSCGSWFPRSLPFVMVPVPASAAVMHVN